MPRLRDSSRFAQESRTCICIIPKERFGRKRRRTAQLAMRLRSDRRSGSVLLRRLRWNRRSILLRRRRSWRSSRCRRICGTASHERSRQLKLSYALSFGLEFFQLTLTLQLSFVLFVSFLSLQLRVVGSPDGKLLCYPVSFSLHLCRAR